jgi:hypothetical protein
VLEVGCYEAVGAEFYEVVEGEYYETLECRLRLEPV